MMEPQVCLTQLANMLADETRLLGKLALQLQREHELLVANDVEGLEQAAEARQASVAGLSRVDQERRNLCRVLGYGTDHLGLGALLKWCDPPDHWPSRMPLHPAKHSCAVNRMIAMARWSTRA